MWCFVFLVETFACWAVVMFHTVSGMELTLTGFSLEILLSENRREEQRRLLLLIMATQETTQWVWYALRVTFAPTRRAARPFLRGILRSRSVFLRGWGLLVGNVKTRGGSHLYPASPATDSLKGHHPPTPAIRRL